VDEGVEPPPRRPVTARRRRLVSEPPITVGGVLSKTFAAWARNFVPFSLISLVVHAPLLAFGAWAMQDAERYLEHVNVLLAVMLVGGVLLGTVVTAAYTYGVVQQLRGRPATLGKTVATGFARTPAALLTVIAAWIVMVLPLLPAVAMLLVAKSPVGFFLLLLAGMFVLLVVLTLVWVAVPATVVEGTGPYRSLGRSAVLTSGVRLRVFGILLVLWILSSLSQKLVEAAVSSEEWSTLRVQIWILYAVQFLFIAPLQSIASAVGYHDLRTKKEGVDVEDLARVFE
jgi:hypothetical protein